MNAKSKLIVGIAASAAILGAAGFTIAADDDRPLEGRTYGRATTAALDHVGGGKVIETESGDGDAAYGVEIRRRDGSVVEVELDDGFDVIATEADDDAGEGEDDD